ncbi:capsular biosynthesis protein [Ensifer sp. IC3342]|nr:capsular biosynthesis protein [Ensifer sp. BRP08]MCA1448004.1 capsular biosynthesis protein [Ensifer sp. IC3342]
MRKATDSLPGATDKNWYPPEGTRLGTTFFVRSAFPWLGHHFGIPLGSTLSPGIDGIVSWGGRIPAKSAMAVARLRRLPHWHLEDGFLRSVGLGKDGAAPVSIIVDDRALPVDAGKASRLELLIAAAANGGWDSFGKSIRERMLEHKLSKYNNLPHKPPSIEQNSRKRILLVDQVLGDVSVERALGSRHSFDRMLDDALASGAQCVVRTHPDVMAGYRKGYMTERAARTAGVALLADRVSVASILDVVDEVWTVSSQVGFDALLRKMPVRCYAVPFYAGWGLTDDRAGSAAEAALARRAGARPSVDQLTAATLGLYPSYRNPKDWQPMDVFAAIDFLVAEVDATRRA